MTIKQMQAAYVRLAFIRIDLTGRINHLAAQGLDTADLVARRARIAATMDGLSTRIALRTGN